MGHVARYKTHVLCLAAGPDACPPGPRPGSARDRLSAQWGPTLEKLTDPAARANCLASLQEVLAAQYLQPAGIRWDDARDSRGLPVRLREFLDTEPGTLRLGTKGLTLMVHPSLEIRTQGSAGPSQIHTPIWMVESNNPQIIDGHSDFTRQPLRDFLLQLYHDRVMYGRDLSMLLRPEEQCTPR
jgi:hypothetical protein